MALTKCDILAMDIDAESISILKKHYGCRYFRILVIGRANAGKTTILEKVCGVAQGTQPIIYDQYGFKLKANIKPKPEPKPEPMPHELSSKARFKLPIKQLFSRKPVSSTTHLIPLPVLLSTHLTPSIEVSCHMVNLDVDFYPLLKRGIHDIEHQITYPGSNFIFHDSLGFEAGASEEMEIVWNFIEKRTTAVEMQDQLHAIWYLIFVPYIAG